MKRTVIAFVFLLTALCWISCEKDIEFKGEITDPFLVMNGFLSSDSAVSVHLSQSRFVLNGYYSDTLAAVENATVSLYVNEVLKEKLAHVSQGIYRGSYLPRPLDRIRVEAEAAGFDAILAETLIPKGPDVTTVDSVITITESEKFTPYYAYGGEEGMEYETTSWNAKLQLKLSDRGGEENYYFIKVKKNTCYQDGTRYSWPVNIDYEELLKNNPSGNADFLEELIFDGDSGWGDNVFNDLFIDGKSLLFDFEFSGAIEMRKYKDGKPVKEEETDEEVTEEYQVIIAEVSKDFYRYVVSANKADNADGNILVEPVQIYNNVENGIGILAGYRSHTVSLRYMRKPNIYDDNGQYAYPPTASRHSTRTNTRPAKTNMRSR
ncbi:MAG TPA: hypothetical protein DDZ96_09270 [Porphyromonadaceae bacterium]|jgi:hypothetical protein|nr:hypothetical protein [Porphyromonadaceae bacterium]HBX47039.1 hypothetical protein [Porphyromonadaceae bacterium]HCM19230.1 hypothetical protein [Porphyromonadaceae bacterium]